MKLSRMFHNTPNSTPEKIPSEIKEDTFVMGSMLVTGIKILLVMVIVGFLGWKIVNFGVNMVQTRGELLFAIQHPDMVQPIRELYEANHKQADKDLIKILTGGNE